jgi:hypothetical protein
MPLYTILGLTATDHIRNSYETDSSGRILLTPECKGISKLRKTTDYIIYLEFSGIYYEIHLLEIYGASFTGFLYSQGYMKVAMSYNIPENITHSPIKPLYVYANFEEAREYYFDEEVDVHLYDEPDTRVFRYSGIGSGDESVPDGYVIVNMDLFWKHGTISKL